MGKGEIFGLFRRGLPPPAPLRLNPGGAGAGGAILRQAGGLPRRCRITLPSLSPTGGGGFGRRIYQPYHKVFPLSPQPPSRREGGVFWFISPGATAPGPPAPEPGRHRSRGRNPAPSGGLPRRCRITLPSLSPMGRAAVWVAGFTSHITRFFPYPPAPLPGGKGEFFGLFRRGLPPPAPLRLNPGGAGTGAAYHAPTRARAERGRFVTGRGANGGLHQQFIREKFLGVWGLLSRSPQRFFVSLFLRSFVFSL